MGFGAQGMIIFSFKMATINMRFLISLELMESLEKATFSFIIKGMGHYAPYVGGGGCYDVTLFHF